MSQPIFQARPSKRSRAVFVSRWTYRVPPIAVEKSIRNGDNDEERACARARAGATGIGLSALFAYLVAIAMMSTAGYWLARHGGYRPWRTAAIAVVLGTMLVAIVIALGG